jgi:hypothetical protein
MANSNINVTGLVTVGMFVVTWSVALLVREYGHIEEKWTSRLVVQTRPTQFEQDLAAQEI